MEVTREMIKAVKEYECSISGHTFSVIGGLAGNPIVVFCDHCDKVWNVNLDT